MARRADDDTARGQAPGGMFLGAVVARSAADQEATMSAEFSLLAARFSQLVAQYHSGELGAEELAGTLAAERVWDTDGGEWTIGAASGAWYRRVDGEGWTQVPPPGPQVQAVVRLVAEDRDADGKAAPLDPFATLYAVSDEGDGDLEVVMPPTVEGLVELYPTEPKVVSPSSPVGGAGDEAVTDPYVTDERGTALPDGTGNAQELARRWLDG